MPEIMLMAFGNAFNWESKLAHFHSTLNFAKFCCNRQWFGIGSHATTHTDTHTHTHIYIYIYISQSLNESFFRQIVKRIVKYIPTYAGVSFRLTQQQSLPKQTPSTKIGNIADGQIKGGNGIPPGPSKLIIVVAWDYETLVSLLVFLCISSDKILLDINDDVIKWNHFPRYCPFVREFHWWPVNSPHRGQWRGGLMFSLIYGRINGWVNNGEAGNLRHHHTHSDVIVMQKVSVIVLSFTKFILSNLYPVYYQNLVTQSELLTGF